MKAPLFWDEFADLTGGSALLNTWDYILFLPPGGCCAVPLCHLWRPRGQAATAAESVGRIWLRNHLPRTRRGKKGKRGQASRTSHLPPSKDFLPRWNLAFEIQCRRILVVERNFMLWGLMFSCNFSVCKFEPLWYIRQVLKTLLLTTDNNGVRFERMTIKILSLQSSSLTYNF